VTDVLTSFDDYPIHQTSAPVAHTATADANHYDRYFFNGYTADGSLFFALAMGLYPNRSVHDAAFCVVRDGVQSSVFASGRAPLDRMATTTVGPIRVEVVEPLRVLRVLVDAPEQGLRAELRFDARSSAVEEPPFRLVNRTHVVLDITRLTQFGRWTGWIDVDGQRIDITPDAVVGSRDRSWGVRPVGEPRGGAPATSMPQYFWLWAPVNFPTFAAHFDVNEFADGRRWHEIGCVIPDGGDAEHAETIEWSARWRPGTRWADAFEVVLGGIGTLSLAPMFEFHMSGIGYGHSEWSHGTWRGESAVGGERVTLPVSEPLRRDRIHVQAICRATFTGIDGSTATGVGALEQMFIGPHPSGFTGLLEGYSG
jgi:hypothetical protein